jgi:uncharacterized protein YqeY
MAALEKQVVEEMKTAMRAKDKDKLEALRSIKSAILSAKTEKGAQAELSEDQELKLLQKLQKQRKDALEVYQQQDRQELAKTEQKQLEVIELFLPQPLSLDELKAKLKEIIAEVGASSPKDMGKVMGKASKELAGRADGKTISATVKELLGKA